MIATQIPAAAMTAIMVVMVVMVVVVRRADIMNMVTCTIDVYK